MIAVVAYLLPHQLIHPLGRLVISTLGLQTGNYERHVGDGEKRGGLLALLALLCFVYRVDKDMSVTREFGGSEQ